MSNKQEPVARVIGVHGGMFVVEPLNRAMVLSTNMALYTHPQPKREWVGLTLEEIDKTPPMHSNGGYEAYARAIEAKLKEKNHD